MKDNRSNKEKDAEYVCFECGVGYLSKKDKKEDGHAVTFSNSNCDLCGEFKGTTSVRHYNYLHKQV